jgi:phenylacetate-coenzyme A ligase PaaK-like adenylate-forming protein
MAAKMIEREYWPHDAFHGYREDRLRETVLHAVMNSIYYRETLGNRVKGAFRLQDLPVLTKSTLMACFDYIVTDPRLRLADVERHLAGPQAGDPLLGQYRVFASGGTTGRRAIMVYDDTAWDLAVANVLRGTAMMGATAQTRVLAIGAPTPLHLTSRLFAELRPGRGDAPRLAVTMATHRIVEALNGYRPELLITYPSLIRQLAAEQRSGRLRISPSRFCSMGESLTPDLRDLVLDTWGVAVLDSYAATEVGLIGMECPATLGMHVADDLMILEIVDRENRPVAPGTCGAKVLVTTLYNRTLPLIRYEIPDLVTEARGGCPCGRLHLRLDSIRGRHEDVLTLPWRDGGIVSLHAMRLCDPLLRMPGVRQFQLVVEGTGLRVRLSLADKLNTAESRRAALWAIQAELDRIGAAPESLRIEVCDEIEPKERFAYASV